ncbi:MAG: DUF169 domain-containing protein [Nitrospirales bacterium]
MAFRERIGRVRHRGRSGSGKDHLRSHAASGAGYFEIARRISSRYKAEVVPDIIVVEDTIEGLMWLTLAYLHATGGERVSGTTAVLQAVCADSTIIPYQEQRLNFGYGCYGCREATDIGPNETVVGFPISFLSPIVEQLEFLNQKAIPVSRSKRALKALQKADQEPEVESGAE